MKYNLVICTCLYLDCYNLNIILFNIIQS